MLLMSGETVLGHVNCTKWAACCCWLGYPTLKWNGDTQITASHIRPSVSKASKLWNSLCTNTDYEFLFWMHQHLFVHDGAFEIFQEFWFWWKFTLNYIGYIQQVSNLIWEIPIQSKTSWAFRSAQQKYTKKKLSKQNSENTVFRWTWGTTLHGCTVFDFYIKQH